MMRRFLPILLIVFFLLSSPALAVTYGGGSQAQRDFAREVVESSWFPWQWVDEELDEVDILMEEHHPPYWEFLDELGAAAGLASYGKIWIDSDYQPGYDSFFGEIVAHEWAHQIWFTMPWEWKNKWVVLCTGGIGDYDPDNWYEMPAENFAECVRVAIFGPEYYYNDAPRTHLRVISVADTREFLSEYHQPPPPTPPPPPPPPLPFWDLEGEDQELIDAAQFLKDNGIIIGYEDASFGPYQPLLRRHIALIAERVGWVTTLSTEDYSVALRADVRDNIPGLTWLEERWDEEITRGQLARLIWRSEHGTL